MEKIAIDQTVILQCKNGAVIVGPWKGAGMFNTKPIVTVGRRSEYFDNVDKIDIVVTTEAVYDSTKPVH